MIEFNQTIHFHPAESGFRSFVKPKSANYPAKTCLENFWRMFKRMMIVKMAAGTMDRNE